jgi:hypothetical protein
MRSVSLKPGQPGPSGLSEELSFEPIRNFVLDAIE